MFCVVDAVVCWTRVVLSPNSGVSEPFTLPPNAEFSMEHQGFIGQSERGLRCVAVILTLVRQCLPELLWRCYFSQRTELRCVGKSHRWVVVFYFLNATLNFRIGSFHSEILQRIFLSSFWSLIDENHEDPDVCVSSRNNNQSAMQPRRSVHSTLCHIHNRTVVVSRYLPMQNNAGWCVTSGSRDRATVIGLQWLLFVFLVCFLQWPQQNDTHFSHISTTVSTTTHLDPKTDKPAKLRLKSSYQNKPTPTPSVLRQKPSISHITLS